MSSPNLSPAQRQRLIEQYATGAERLRAAVERVPAEARQWRPSPGEFSVHEVVCHCADSETNAHMRIRYLAAEAEPTITGYDPGHWAREFDYHQHPLDAALATVEAVRANTVPFLRHLPESAWTRVGTHTESGRYTPEDWLAIYAAHVEGHVAQIGEVHAAWQNRG